MLAPVLAAFGVWIVAAAPASPPETASDARLPGAPLEVPSAESPAREPATGGGFFQDEVGATPPPAAVEGPAVPPMPVVEELPSREAKPASGGPKVVFGGEKGRKPIAGGGADFFDPGKLGDTGPASGGGVLQIRGYLGFNFVVAERTNTAMRNPETGTFDRLKTLPYFGGGAANLYVGAPIYADVVYARIAFEFISLPRAYPGAADVAPTYAPVVLMEAAALEINPFAWAKKAPRWFAEGFKISGGVFIVPFGLEDEEHDAPVRWWVTRPLAMSIGRVYPGSWIDVGATIKWKPTFGGVRPIRPIELDFGVINGDACTQTRAMDQLYRYQPVGRIDETCEHRLRSVEKVLRGDGAILGISPDNNGNKSIVARAQIRPIPALNFGGSFVWGKHPQSTFDVTSFLGMTYVDSRQAPTWRAGGHLDLNLDEAIQSPFPLPHLRAEVVYGVDAAAPPSDPANPTLSDRHMLGGYAQIAQPLWRRKKTRLPGLIVQYRFDHADPDLKVPGRRPGGTVVSDFSDEFRYDEAMQAHVIGLRFPVLPRFTLKTEYMFLREDGGRANRVFNDSFSLQAVADF